MNVKVRGGSLCSLVITNDDGTRLEADANAVAEDFSQYLKEEYDFHTRVKREEGPLKNVLSNNLYNVMNENYKAPVYRILQTAEEIKIMRMGMDRNSEPVVNGYSDEEVFRSYKEYADSLLNVLRLPPGHALLINSTGNGDALNHSWLPGNKDVRSADYREPANR